MLNTRVQSFVSLCRANPSKNIEKIRETTQLLLVAASSDSTSFIFSFFWSDCAYAFKR